jgi:virginiamycin B lyase
MRKLVAGIFAVCSLSLIAGPGGATTGTPTVRATPAAASGAGKVTNYTDPSIHDPYGIAAGPDGALWFTNNHDNKSIGRISTAGKVTHYTDPSISDPKGIVAGPDGALWFTNHDSIGRITTAGTVSRYLSPGIRYPQGIVVGPDGALWFTNHANSIGRITTSGKVTSYTIPGISYPWGIAVGSDGALWFTDTGGTETNGSIGRITTTGTITSYYGPEILNPEDISAGTDGALWFRDGNESLGRITTSGTVTNYRASELNGVTQIATGPDGALWFTNAANNTIGRITTTGTVTSYTDPSISYPYAIAAGPDDALWFTNVGSNSIGRITTSVTREAMRFTPITGAQTVDATCRFWGSFSPTPYVTPNPTATVFPFSGSADNYYNLGCPVPAGPNPASITGTLRSASAYCTGLNVRGTESGKLTITWPDATTSILRVSLTWSTRFPDLYELTGAVKSGHYAGDKLHARLDADMGGSCDSPGIYRFDVVSWGIRHTQLLSFYRP